MQSVNQIATYSSISRAGFYESIILNALKEMTRGYLILTLPDGKTLEFGNEPEGLRADLHVLSPQFFRRCVLFADIGFGESFELGEWESDDLVGVISWMILNVENHPSISGSKRRSLSMGVFSFIHRIQHGLRNNTIRGSQKNIAAHYDLSNDFFRHFLDEGMTYSSADYVTGLETLEEAQTQKYDRLCQSLRFSPTDHVLEIGTGWGGFAIHAAKRYGCHITTSTISKQQFICASERIQKERLENKIEIVLLDYRKLTGHYDKIVSIEMIEAVGANHLKTYFQICERLLKKNGLLGLQVILSADHRFNEMKKSVDWTQKYIFPGSIIPSLAALHEASKNAGRLNLYGLHDMGKSYALTLKEWRRRFMANLTRISALGFDDTFHRRWNYYLSYCEAAFTMRHITVGQLLYSRPNNEHY